MRGITEVTATDFEYARSLGGTIKLLGVAKLGETDGTRAHLSAFVSPRVAQCTLGTRLYSDAPIGPPACTGEIAPALPRLPRMHGLA